MDFVFLFFKWLLIGCVVAAPAGILFTPSTAPSWLKASRLLFPIVLLFLIISYGSLSECVQSTGIDCWSFKMFFIILGTLEYVMFLGWFEYIWRRIHKQIEWPLKANLKYGILSNGVICVSGCMTLILFSFVLFDLFQRD